jgi:hypothetical protein
LNFSADEAYPFGEMLPSILKMGYPANGNRKNCCQDFNIWGCVATFTIILQQYEQKLLLPS